VKAALAAGVLDPANLRRSVCGFVQQRAEQVAAAILQPFTAHEQLVHALVAAHPSVCGEVAELQALRGAAGTDRHDDLGHVRVALLDRMPGAFDHVDEDGGNGCGLRVHVLLSLVVVAVWRLR
jgi:hypothetical protein